MAQTQIDFPDDIDRKIKIFSIENKIDDKRDAVIEIVKRYFKGV